MRILVVDNNVELCKVLTEFFNSQEDMKSVGEAYDGEQALVKIQELEPNVVILDITMPHLDGIGVLERLNKMNLKIRPRIIVLTAFGKDDLISRLTELGVEYFVIKPFNLNLLAARVRQFAAESPAYHHDYLNSGDNSVTSEAKQRDLKHEGETRNQYIVRLLREMGVPPHFKGFTNLREAACMCDDSGYVGGNLTKELYPALAKKYNSTVGGVEAAIRNAVVSAWENGNTEFIQKMCGEHRGQRIPTNSLIIAKLAEEARVS